MRLKNKFLAAGCVMAAAGMLVTGLACNEHELSPFSKSLAAGKLQNSSSGSARAVDILFVIDNSNSMEEEQRDLDKNFRTFLDKLIEANADFHLAVVSTEWLNTSSLQFVTNAMKPGSDTYVGSISSSLKTGRKVLEDAGVSTTEIDDAYNKCLAYFEKDGSPRTFIASSDDEISSLTGDERADYVKQLFRCESMLGTRSDDAGIERGLATMVTALNTASNVNRVNGKDVKFKRDGSILAIVFVTDENDCSNVLELDSFENLSSIKNPNSSFDTISTDMSSVLKLCETKRNIEDSCTITREDRILTTVSDGSSIRVADGDNISGENAERKSLREWCVQGDEAARKVLTDLWNQCETAEDKETCRADIGIDCPEGGCANLLNSRADMFESVISLMLSTNKSYYETTNKEMLDAAENDSARKDILRTLAKQDVIVANIINRDRGIRYAEGVTDNWCGGSGNESYRYQLFGEMFDNDPIYAPICCRREAFYTAADGSTESQTVCSKEANGTNAEFGPVLGVIGTRIGKAVNTLCTDTAPLTCKPEDCNGDKPKSTCPCLYGCNAEKTYFAGTDREYNVCNEFRMDIGTIDPASVEGGNEPASSENSTYSHYVEGTNYSLDFESSYCYTRTGSPIQINLQKNESGKLLVIEYPKNVSGK